VSEALEILTGANRILNERKLRGALVVSAPMALAAARLAVAEQSGGADRAAALATAKHACKRALEEGKILPFWLPTALRLHGTYEWLCGKPSAAQRWWQRSLTAAEKVSALHEFGLTLLELGRRTRRPAALRRAETCFLKLGAHLGVEEARRLLAAAEV
jgi:hypothetical protein